MKTVSEPAGVHFMMRLCGMSAKSRNPECIQIGPSVHVQSSASFSIFAPAGTMASRPGSALSTEPTVSSQPAVFNAVEVPRSLLASTTPINNNPAIQCVFIGGILQQFCASGVNPAGRSFDGLRRPSHGRPAAFLVFLPAAAGARLVAGDFSPANVKPVGRQPRTALVSSQEPIGVDTCDCDGDRRCQLVAGQPGVRVRSQHFVQRALNTEGEHGCKRCSVLIIVHY